MLTFGKEDERPDVLMSRSSGRCTNSIPFPHSCKKLKNYRYPIVGAMNRAEEPHIHKGCWTLKEQSECHILHCTISHGTDKNSVVITIGRLICNVGGSATS